MKPKKLPCLEEGTPQEPEDSLMLLSSWVGPGRYSLFLPQNALGAVESQEKFWGILRWRDLTLLEALCGGVEVTAWRLVQRGLTGGFRLEQSSLFPRWFSPVLQDSSQMFPLWEDYPTPQSGLPVSSPLGLLVPHVSIYHKQIT